MHRGREDADLQPLVGSTRSLKRATASVSIFSTHVCIEGQHALRFACSCTPSSPAPDTNKGSGSFLASACPGREEAAMIQNLPLQQNFLVLAALWYLLLWATLQVFSVHCVLAENDTNSSKTFCQRGTHVFPLVLTPTLSICLDLDKETASAQARISRKLYRKGGKIHPKCRWIPDQTRRRNPSKHQRLSPAFQKQMQHGQIPDTSLLLPFCFFFFVLLAKCQTMS